MRVHTFNAEQSAEYWTCLEKFGLKIQYYGRILQFGHPVVVSRSLVESLLDVVRKIYTNVIPVYTTDAAALTNYLAERAPVFYGTRLNFEKINSQLVALTQSGMRIPFAYDVLAKGEGHEVGFSCIEFQSTVGYAGMMHLMQDAAISADPALGELSRMYGDPLDDFKKIRNLSDERIIVMDVDPLTGSSSSDKIVAAQILGDESSLPVSPTDVYRKNDKWHVYVRDQDGSAISSLEVKSVLTRMTAGDMKKLELAVRDDASKQATLTQFFGDEAINWMWHPAWSYLLHKGDLPLLSNIEPDHATPIYEQGEQPIPGIYMLKPNDGSCGDGVEMIGVTDSGTYTVPKGCCLQSYIVAHQLKVPVKDRSELGVIELRAMPQHAAGFNPGNTSNLSTYIQARLGPYHDKHGCVTLTNTKRIDASLEHLMQEKGYDNHKEMPFGFSPVFIE